jgi:hypothetical protein
MKTRMKMSEVRKVISTLQKSGEHRLAKVFARSVTGSQKAVDKVADMFKDKTGKGGSNPERSVKKRKNVAKLTREGDKKLKMRAPKKNGGKKGDPIGKEFAGKKREASVEKA